MFLRDLFLYILLTMFLYMTLIALLFQPVGFVTFSSRVAAEAAKQDLQVRVTSLLHFFFEQMVFNAKLFFEHDLTLKMFGPLSFNWS